MLPDTPAAPPPRRRRGRPKGDEARTAILSAAHDLLLKDGMAGFTIEGVAARAGAAKTTIYRMWSSKGTLAIEGFLAATAPKTAFPETDDPVADVKAQMRLLAQAYRGQTGRTVSGLIAEAQADPKTARTLIEGYIRPRREAAFHALRRAIETGALRSDPNLEIAVDALYGPIFYRMLVGHGPLDQDWLDGLADSVFAGLRVR